MYKVSKSEYTEIFLSISCKEEIDETYLLEFDILLIGFYAFESDSESSRRFEITKGHLHSLHNLYRFAYL